MPRHRVSRPKAPKPPKQVRVKKPAAGKLHQVYKGLLTTDIGQRIAVLNSAMHWYDGLGLPYIMFKNSGSYTVAQAKEMDIASKCRMKGMSTHSNNEKEEAYKLAVTRYERICAELSPPKLSAYYDDLKSRAEALKERQARLENRYGTIVQILTKALKPVNTQGQAIEVAVGHVKDEFRMDPARSQLTLRRDVVKELRYKMRREGVLSVVRAVIEPLSRLAAMKPEMDAVGAPTGRYVVAYQDRFEQTMKMLDNLIAWGKTDEAPKRFVRPAQVVIPGQVPTKRTGGVSHFKKGPKIADAFTVGTLIARLYTEVMDGNWHGYADLRNVIHGNQATLLSKMKWIDGVGKRKTSASGEGWTVEFASDKCRLVYSSPVYQQKAMASAQSVGKP